jgi:hypothetical protein
MRAADIADEIYRRGLYSKKRWWGKHNTTKYEPELAITHNYLKL